MVTTGLSLSMAGGVLRYKNSVILSLYKSNVCSVCLFKQVTNLFYLFFGTIVSNNREISELLPSSRARIDFILHDEGEIKMYTFKFIEETNKSQVYIE